MKTAGQRDERLPRQRRLQTPAEFQRVRRLGERMVYGCLIVNWMPIPNRPYSRLGVVTSRKTGGSVVRSRSRRLMREAFRRHQWEFQPAVDLVLVARRSINGKSRQEVERDFLTVLNRAGLLSN